MPCCVTLCREFTTFLLCEEALHKLEGVLEEALPLLKRSSGSVSLQQVYSFLLFLQGFPQLSSLLNQSLHFLPLPGPVLSPQRQSA